MIETRVVAILAVEFAGAPAIADDACAQGGGLVLGSCQVAEAVGVCLDQEDMTERAYGRDHIHVERDLIGPPAPRIRARIIAGLALLIDLVEAPVGGRTRWQLVERAI